MVSPLQGAPFWGTVSAPQMTVVSSLGRAGGVSSLAVEREAVLVVVAGGVGLGRG